MESTTNRSGLQCYEHPRQQITNYCVYYDCLRPLCPDCVQVHTKLHQRQQIQSWKHCINKAASSTKLTLDQLRAIYQMVKNTKGIKSIQIVQAQNINKLSALKDKYHRIVEQVFRNHQNTLRAYIRSQYKIDAPDTSKLKMAIDQMEKVLMKLSHSTTVLGALKKCLLLDHKSVVDYFSNLKNNRQMHINQNFFVENSSSLAQFKNILQKSISLDSMADSNLNDRIFSSPYRDARSSRGINFESLKIFNKDYFLPECKNKYLHFFVPNSKQLKLLKIQQAQKQNWKTVQFNSKTNIPCYFKSIITPQGDIYLTGGLGQQSRIKNIFKYNYQKNSLDLVGNMLKERSSHSLCYLDGAIYIIGGFSQKQGQVTRQCQIFNLSTLNSTKIAPLNTPSANSCTTPFKDQYIFKFGGIFNKNQGNSLVQIYSIRSNKWIVATIQNPKSNMNLQLLSFSAASQINQNQILVFGGYQNTQQERPQRTCYSITVNAQINTVYVKNYNKTPLPFAQGFWNNNPIIYRQALYALQNVADQHDEQTALADERKVIIFNGQRWL